MLFEKEEYTPAIRLYNEAIKRYNTSPVLYGNRAAAYMKRDWSVANNFFLLFFPFYYFIVKMHRNIRYKLNYKINTGAFLPFYF